MKENIKFSIEVFTFFTTLIAIIFTSYTLKEMKEQRIQSSMPDVVVNTSKWQLSMMDHLGLRYFYRDLSNSVKNMEKQIEENEKVLFLKYTEDYSQIFNNEYKELFLNVYNVGLGVAKDVNFIWYYNIDELEAIDPYKTNKRHEENLNKWYRDSYLNKDKYENEIEFIMPGNSYVEYSSIKISEDYLELLAHELGSFLDASILSPYPYLPSLYLGIEYMGIEGNNYKKMYKLSPIIREVERSDSMLYENTMIVTAEFKITLMD